MYPVSDLKSTRKLSKFFQIACFFYIRLLVAQKSFPDIVTGKDNGVNDCHRRFLTVLRNKQMAENKVSLVIAEKPSVAGDIARALGGFKQDENGFWRRDDMVIGSAVGHLLEIVAPEDQDVKRGRWTFKNLPVLPTHFDLKPIKRTQTKLNLLLKEIRKRNVSELINACDAGREGELIFRLILQEAATKKPCRRLWLQSMTKQAIKDGFAQLRSDEEMRPLEAAARCRAEADWLVGINGTRAMTAFNSKGGGFFLTTVGRVQTPTLAIVVKREMEIRAFKPEPYWTVQALFDVKSGQYKGTWIDTQFKKDPNNPHAKPERLWNEAQAKRILALCQGGQGTIEETKKRVRQMAPALFDLTSLQREANQRFGFSAKTTLQIAQALYEKHKVLTYPRTDARALPEDYVSQVEKTIGDLASMDQYAPFSRQIVDSHWVVKDKRIFDNSKISDHFAIIPTGVIPKSLTDAEQRIYDMVVRRLLAIFYPAAEYDVTTRLTTVEGEVFKSEGKVLVKPGWLEPAGRNLSSTKDLLVETQPGEIATVDDIQIEALETRPPARYSEATLLGAMEKAGKTIDENELRDAMGDKGLGTPATRAGIIEGLLDQKYMRREERELIPTSKAFQLITLLEGLKISELSDPRLTAEWEQKLSRLEQGEFSSTEFMSEIRQLTKNIVAAASRYEGDSVPVVQAYEVKAPCPRCQGKLVENYNAYACTTPDCGFRIPKHLSGRMFDEEEVETLLTDRHIGPLKGFISRKGWPFEAELVIAPDENDQLSLKFDFPEEETNNEELQEEIENAKSVGVCPKCKGRVLDLSRGYTCENVSSKKCDFRMGKTILSRDITPEDVNDLLENGKTKLLTGFISKRNQRAFSAYLVWDAKKGSVGFEFEARKAKSESAESKTTTKAKTTRTTRKKA